MRLGDGVGDIMVHATVLELDVDKARALLNDIYAEMQQTGEAVSAQRIWLVCEHLSEINVKRITAKAVGDRCTRDFGGPRAQSIRNKTKTLAELVRRWDDYHSLKSGRTSASRKNARPKFIVDDPTTVAYVNLLEREVQELKKTVTRLNNGIRNLEPLQTSRSGESDRCDFGSPTSPITYALSATERDSILRFLNLSHLERFDLVMDNRNRIKQGPRVLMERPVVELLKVLATGLKFDDHEQSSV
jgi:hypothetical protein